MSVGKLYNKILLYFLLVLELHIRIHVFFFIYKINDFFLITTLILFYLIESALTKTKQNIPELHILYKILETLPYTFIIMYFSTRKYFYLIETLRPALY